MIRRLRGLALVPVLLGLACERPSARAESFTAHEEGLTLAYENPSLPPGERRDTRLQVRVAKVAPAPGGGLLLATTLTTLKGEFTVTTLLKDGGLRMLGPEGKSVTLLPEGFPERTPAWTEDAQRFTVIGRALLPDLQVELPQGANPMGLWVEARPVAGAGPVSRTYFLPDIGEVETRELREGRWIVVKRLVSRGFTQVPAREFTP